MDYVIAVQAPAYRLSPTRFATESAFAEHLRELRRSVGSKFDKVVLIAPTLPEDEYQAKAKHLGIVDATEDGIEFMPMHVQKSSVLRFWANVPSMWKRARQAVRTAGVVHSGLSDDVKRPLMAMLNLAGWLAKRPVIFIVDIDFRQHTRRFYRLGKWSLKSYLINTIVYDPLKYLQVWLAVRMYDLVLLKSASMVSDFGKGRPNVKNFHDTVHSIEDVLSVEAAHRRARWLADPAEPLRLIYFGRFVPYKGLDRAVEAVRLARAAGHDVRLTLVGEGECEIALREQVVAAGLGEAVVFLPQVKYGPPLFELLENAHMSIATPLVEDTPRAAFDSLARGLPVVAFDISYFKDLASESGAVALAAWPDAASMARELGALAANRARVADMAQRGLQFARDNTQALWLERRADWLQGIVAA